MTRELMQNSSDVFEDAEFLKWLLQILLKQVPWLGDLSKAAF